MSRAGGPARALKQNALPNARLALGSMPSALNADEPARQVDFFLTRREFHRTLLSVYPNSKEYQGGFGVVKPG
jgi:hypothetical protein